MLRNYKKEQEKITFDAMMEILSDKFGQLPDQRRANRSYKLPDILRSAFAMFSLKSPFADFYSNGRTTPGSPSSSRASPKPVNSSPRAIALA